MNTILNNIGTVFYTAFVILLFILAAITLFDYFKDCAAAKKRKKKKQSLEEPKSTLEVTPEGQIITDLGDIVYFINAVSGEIRKLNNPDLKHALEELNKSSALVLQAMQDVVDLNYPLDDDWYED